MGNETRTDYHERVVRTIDYKTCGSAPDVLDADHIREHRCANAQYTVDDSNRALADALEADDLVEVEAATSSPTMTNWVCYSVRRAHD